MSTTQTEKPTLNGVRIRTRKRVTKANEKYEPELFRDRIFEEVGETDIEDISSISTKLDSAGNRVDYRKYGESFYELIVTGGLVLPGGSIDFDKERGALPFSLFHLPDAGDDPLSSVVVWVDIISKLTRRYKYLEKIFSETNESIVQYINQYGSVNCARLAHALGMLISRGVMGVESLKVLQSEHLVRDGLALQFVTSFIKAYLREQSVLHLEANMKKAKIYDFLGFFPQNKRSDEYFVRHFESEDMHELIKLRQSRQADDAKLKVKEEILELIEENIDAETDPKKTIVAVAKLAQRNMKSKGWSESETVVVLCDAVLDAVKWGSRAEVAEQQTLTLVKQYADLFSYFTSTPKAEISFLQHIQTICYQNAKLLRHFTQIISILYNEGAISDSAIIFWHKKGSKPQGRAVFLKQTEKLVAALEAAESDSEED